MIGRLSLMLILLVACIGIAISGGIDFVVYHWAAFLSHTNVEGVYTLPAGSGGYYYYGPIFLAMLSPLGWLGYPVAKAIWIGIQVLSYVFFWWASYQLYPNLKKRALIWLWAFIFAINPIHTTFQCLNIQLLLLAGFLGVELLRRTRIPLGEWCAGVLISILAGIKVYPAFILVFYLIFERRPFRWGAACGLIFSFVAPFLFFGWYDGLILWKGFLFNVAAYTSHHTLSDISFILCLPTMVARVFQSWGIAPIYAKIVTLVLSCLISVFFYGWVYKLKHRGQLKNDDTLALWSLALALMVFLNPSSFIHYFVFYFPAFFWALDRLATVSRFPEKSFLFVGLSLTTLLVSMSTSFVVGRALSHQLELWNIPTLGAMFLMLTLVIFYARERFPKNALVR